MSVLGLSEINTYIGFDGNKERGQVQVDYDVYKTDPILLIPL
jgi:hypothetical protein